MAISVDTVYQRVLAIANKEQRGYITPQEYNLLANQAQMQIFESYFYAKNRRDRMEPNRPSEVDETDIGELLDRKLAPFQEFLPVTSGHTFPTTTTVDSVAYDIFHTGMVFLGDEPCQKVSVFDAQRMRKSTRHMAGTANQAPIYTDNRVSGRDIVVYAGSVDEETGAGIEPDVTVECFRVPRPANWTYVVVNGKALHNGSDSSLQDFELHPSETDAVVSAILTLAGITMKNADLTQIGSAVNQANVQLENQ